ncbi:MAG: single-stranded DNA-binding protein [Kiritimatiellia bacterium]|nr:single-stranded DNA-binding protein [Kiritimatiellia bacterium]
MPSLNKVFLMGNLTRDPEVRVTPARMSVTDFSLAVSRRYRSATGEEKEDRCFVRVTAWGATAEAVGRSLKRGSPVYVEGRLKYDEWERDGVKQNRLGVVAERVLFLNAPPARSSTAPDDVSPSVERRIPTETAPAGEAPDAANSIDEDGKEHPDDPDDLPF